MNLLTFILACYGMTMIVVYGKIFNAIRPQHHFFHCPLCMGWWVGVFINALMFYLDISFMPQLFIGSFIAGCISSGTSYLLSMIVNDEGIKINLGNKK